MTIVHFVIPGQPQGKGRPRVGKIGQHVRMFTPAKTVAYEGLVALAAQEAMREAGAQRFEAPVKVSMHLWCEIPASWSQKKLRQALAGEIYPGTKPDVDNVVKAVFDGLNGVLWRDDVLVVELRVRKHYAASPRVVVEVQAMGAKVEQGELLGEAA